MRVRKAAPLPRRLRFGPGPCLRIRQSQRYFGAAAGSQGQQHYGFTLHRPQTHTLHVRWDGVGDFAIQRGRAIIAQARKGAPWGEFRDVLLSNILAFALLEQGVETLHASAVEIGGRAVLFAGRPGSAKSTLAALFVRRGGRVLTDDLLPLHPSGKRILAYPSLSEIKLTPAAARALGVRWRQCFPVSPRLRKRVWRARAARGPRPLAALYFPVLSRRSRRVVLRPLSHREAFRALLSHNFNAVLVTRRRMRRLFALCTQIAQSVPARRLVIPRGWKNLDAVARRIEADLKQLRG